MIVEATLLIEAGGKDRYDRIVIVDVDPETQLARAIARGMTREDAARRIAHQMPREERLRYADYVIDNSGDLRRGRGGDEARVRGAAARSGRRDGTRARNEKRPAGWRGVERA